MSNYPSLYRVFETISPSGVVLKWQEFTVIGETPRCWYVIRKELAYLAERATASEAVMRHRKRVLKDQYGRRFCYADKRLAMESYRTRKRRQLGHAEMSKARAEAGFAAAEKLLAAGGEICLPVTAASQYIQELDWSDY
jgi:hypothetical protein